VQLEDQLQQSLAEIPGGQDKMDGMAIGVSVADQILAFAEQ